MRRFVNPFDAKGNWYKANLHTHTTTSDGAATVAEAVTGYRRKGYDVLALTDHDATNIVRDLSDDKMLVVSGMEYHPPLAGRRESFHLVAIGVPHGFEFDDCTDANRCIAQVARAGGETILAHPFWSGMEHADFRHLEGLAGVEVWNTVCDHVGRPCSENEWAYALDRGMHLPAVAVDDTHWKLLGGAIDKFGGWTWLKMRSLSVAGVMKAIRSGAYYASCGPKIHDFRVEGGRVSVRCSPARAIYFKSIASEGERRVAKPGKTVRGFSMDVEDCWEFVRAVVTDAAGKQAWTNPIYLK